MQLLSRYLAAQFFRWFLLCMVAAGGIFLVVDFFTNAEDFTGNNAPFTLIVRYFLFKLPKILIEVFPAGALMAVLVSLGIMADNRELLAMRACGVENRRLAGPLLVAGAALSIGALLWNEIVVPPTASKARSVKDFEIERKQQSGDLDAVALWFQGEQGFFYINYFDANRDTLYGITLHELDPSFRLVGVVEAPVAYWVGESWSVPQGAVIDLRPGAPAGPRTLREGELVIPETPQEFRRKRRRSYEFDSRGLSEQIRLLQAKGLDASEYLVDLYFKLAMPFSGMVAVAIGFAVILRSSRRAGLAANLGVAMAIVFAYWATMAVTVSAGHAGNLPPLVAAWAANLTFLAVAAGLYLWKRD